MHHAPKMDALGRQCMQRAAVILVERQLVDALIDDGALARRYFAYRLHFAAAGPFAILRQRVGLLAQKLGMANPNT